MSGAGRSGDWASASDRGPTVRVVATHPGGPPGASRPPRSRPNASSQGLYVWIVMSLLIASTALALYDLYLLASFVTAT